MHSKGKTINGMCANCTLRSLTMIAPSFRPFSTIHGNMQKLHGNTTLKMLPYLSHYQRTSKKYVNKNVNIIQPITTIISKNLLTFNISTVKTYRNLSEDVRWTGRDLNPRPFDCESNITTPELPARISIHTTFQSYLFYIYRYRNV